MEMDLAPEKEFKGLNDKKFCDCIFPGGFRKVTVIVVTI